MAVLEFDLFRVTAEGQCDHGKLLGHLQVTPQMAFAWHQLTAKAVDLGQSAQSGGLLCIKLYASLHIRDELHDQHQTNPVELEFYPDSIKVRIPNYGSTVRRLRPFEGNYMAGGSISRNRLSAEIKRSAAAASPVSGPLHVR